MRIGILGGSFDPVHRGHLQIAARALDQLHLDQVRFIPARAQPLKGGRHHAAPEDRVAMLRAAVGADPRFMVDPREIGRPGPSYTVDTLRELKLEHPGATLFLLIGADAAHDLPQWHQSDEIGRLARLAVVPRAGTPPISAPAGAELIQMAPVEISSTAVRAAARRGEPLGQMVPEPVARYIADHQLYLGAEC